MLNNRKQILLLFTCTLVLLLALSIAILLLHNLFASAQIPSPRGVNCGTLYVLGYNNLAYNSKGNREGVRQIATCFWNNYQHCHIATLTVYQRAVDTGTKSVFIVDKSQGKCILTDAVESHTSNLAGSNTNINNYTCNDLKFTNDKLYIYHCGDAGNITISL